MQADGTEYIRHTNLDDYTMTALSLCKAGYGTKAEIDRMDTDEFLDLVEFHQISNAIERYQVQEAGKNGGR